MAKVVTDANVVADVRKELHYKSSRSPSPESQFLLYDTAVI
jgi:hypothetical protein